MPSYMYILICNNLTCIFGYMPTQTKKNDAAMDVVSAAYKQHHLEKGIKLLGHFD